MRTQRAPKDIRTPHPLGGEGARGARAGEGVFTSGAQTYQVYKRSYWLLIPRGMIGRSFFFHFWTPGAIESTQGGFHEVA